MRKYICEGLSEYLALDRKPWHMPGHKRKNYIEETSEEADINMAAFLALDVTEVSGTDDLHHPEEMILKSQQQLTDIYGSLASFYMVNGSTGGILSAIGAVADYGKTSGRSKIIIARNCHKSVFNAVKLFGLEPVYMEPEYVELEYVESEYAESKCVELDISGSEDKYKSHIYGAITLKQIEDVLEENQHICAVVITSPTYEGIVSDVAGIKEMLRTYHIPLIVDEAHGAHLPFLSGVGQLPKSAVSLGADIVVQSLHKTLPALTQTAVLHVNEEGLIEGVKKYLSIFMSSSPSYPMLCSMEQAVVHSQEKKHAAGFDEYLNALRSFRENVSGLKNIKLLGSKAKEVDGKTPTKELLLDESRIVLYGNWSGELIAKDLRRLGNIEIEMSGVNYVVLISTYMDEPKDFTHLERTIKLLDEELDDRENLWPDKQEIPEGTFSVDELYGLVGNVAEANIYVYPPGSYIVAAGEEITREAVDKIIALDKAGKKVVWRI